VRSGLPRHRDTANAAETEALGAEVAAVLEPGDIVLISGELGSGKTTFVRGACRALGVREPVTSPTFTLGRRYEGTSEVGHLDLYRLGPLADEDPALLDDYVGPARITFIEWPEVAGGDLPGDPDAVALRVRLTHAGEDRRKIELEPAG
jgi:tRNA threonylcarbamoyladenosine biosynthesis protein TsaE